MNLPPVRPDCCALFSMGRREDSEGEHHPACEHAPPSPRNFDGATPAQLTRMLKDALGDETPMLRLVPHGTLGDAQEPDD